METITFCVFIHANETYHHHHHLYGNYSLRGKRLFLSTWSRHVILELLKRLFFASAAGGVGEAPNVRNVVK